MLICFKLVVLPLSTGVEMRADAFARTRCVSCASCKKTCQTACWTQRGPSSCAIQYFAHCHQLMQMRKLANFGPHKIDVTKAANFQQILRGVKQLDDQAIGQIMQRSTSDSNKERMKIEATALAKEGYV